MIKVIPVIRDFLAVAGSHIFCNPELIMIMLAIGPKKRLTNKAALFENGKFSSIKSSSSVGVVSCDIVA